MDREYKKRHCSNESACMEFMSQPEEVWSSKLSRSLKVRLFLATVESVLLYGAETWTLRETLKKQLDGCYTRMLRMALHVSWQSRTTNADLYLGLTKSNIKDTTEKDETSWKLHQA